MTLEEFKESLEREEPPQGLSPELEALWQDAKGNWNEAHQICQNAGSVNGDWVHAFLHRKEGDENNASYWYQRADKGNPDCSLDEEWEFLISAFLREDAS